MNSLIEENYLKAIFSLADKHDDVGVKELSEQLGIKMSSVNSMIKKLASKKLVFYEKYKPIKLTNFGKMQAALIIRKHRLTEMYLVEKMGFGWEEVHDIAEQIEHIQSLKFFSKMDELLGFPKFDPHGSPIPDKNGKINKESYVKLSECKPNFNVKITAVINTTEEFLNFLNSKNLKLGMVLNVLSVESFDGSITLCLNNEIHTFSSKACESILVQSI